MFRLTISYKEPFVCSVSMLLTLLLDPVLNTLLQQSELKSAFIKTLKVLMGGCLEFYRHLELTGIYAEIKKLHINSIKKK